MRNALILLVVVALIILVAGAFNNGVVFDIDYVAGTASSVSLFWVSLVVAALVFVAGLGAAWFALSGAKGGRRKLEAELQSTYERLRETERDAEDARSAAAAASTAATAAAAAPPEATVVAEREDATVVVADAPTLVDDEARTIVVDDAATAVIEESPGIAGGEVAAEEAATEEAVADPSPDEAVGERTAITVVEKADEDAGEAPEETVAPVDEIPADGAASQEPDAGDAPGARE